MFKDYEKYLSTSLKVYLFVLMIIFILKIVGLDYFGMDINSPTIVKLSFLFENSILTFIWNFIILYLYTFIIYSICCGKKFPIFESLILTVSDIILQMELYNHNLIYLTTPLEILLWIIFIFIFKQRFNLKRFSIIIGTMLIYQVIILLVRNKNFELYQTNIIIQNIMSFDYLLLCIISYDLYWKGVSFECGKIVGSSLQKKINLKKSLQSLHKNLQSNLKKFKKKDKVEKLAIIIYITLSLIWNILCVILVLLVAKLNDTFIECVFILTSFWLSKRSFGKAFHFDSMLQCFVVSNLTYYLLNRLTTPLGISIFIPILLGVGLSYVTSKFVKKTYKPLYRGMPEDIFEDTIEKVVDKGSLKYKICKEFYIDNVSDLSLSFKYNYSVAGIRKIKDRINDKIKKLN